MSRTLNRVVLSATVGAVALMIPIATASSAPTNYVTSPTACPLTALPHDPATAPWLSATYRAHFSASQLARQVLNCEFKFHSASDAFYAEVGLIGLNKTSNLVYQNENMWLASNTGVLTPQDDFMNLGVPPLTLEDGPDGVYYHPPSTQYQPTIYPNEMAVGASMSPALAEQFGWQLGQEIATYHYMGVQAPDLNLSRIPNWGRAPETFGEDPVLAGELGAQETIGLLQYSHIAVLKHFGLYGQETNRKSVLTTLTGNPLFNTYFRPFAIATNEVANSSLVAKDRQIALMCSYGNVLLQGSTPVKSCTSSLMTSAVATLPTSGLMRSDLDTGTPAYALLHAGVSLIKPLSVSAFQPYSYVTASLRSAVQAAATKVLQVMFSGNLVTTSTYAASKTIGYMTAKIHNNGLTVANLIEARGAVLLKNANFKAPGSLPITSAEHNVVVVAPLDLGQTCLAVARNLAAATHQHVTCATWNGSPNTAKVVIGGLKRSTNGATHFATGTFTAPAAGPYVINTLSFGNSSLSINGVNAQNQPGITEFFSGHYTTMQLAKGQTINLKVFWSWTAPEVTVAPLDLSGVLAAKGASAAIVLAHDWADEGMDRDSLSLPFGQDTVISKIAAEGVPTSVALVTSGPVTMPWLSQVGSVIEFWNPGTNPPLDTVTVGYAATYAKLLDGQLSPSGHLPITFPANENASPMSIGTGNLRYAFWPGLLNRADLFVTTNGGTDIGYQWYQATGWPVLFPFGFGLTYSTMSSSIATNGSCTTNSATSICIPVSVSLVTDSGQPARTAIQVYVSPPDPVGNSLPTLSLGGVGFVTCRNSTVLTGQCASGVTTPITISNFDSGAWNPSSSQYEFLSGCYTFIAANNSADAASALANPSSFPGHVVHATAPFSAATTLSPGGCP